jgi:microcystin-dependent protein
MSDYFLGEIRIFSINYAPSGWLDCNGQILQINGNQALYSLIGTTYGGDGRTTFAVPDLRGRVPLSAGTTSPYATYPVGLQGGVEAVVLGVPNLPVHTHTIAAETAQGTTIDPTGGFFAAATPGSDGISGLVSAPNIYGPISLPSQTVSLNAGVVGAAAGGGAAHPNLQPYLALRFCISTSGIYPTYP